MEANAINSTNEITDITSDHKSLQDRSRRACTQKHNSVNDTFVIWPHCSEKLSWNYLNKIQSKIKFIIKTKDQNQLPFLDILVKNKIRRHLPKMNIDEPLFKGRFTPSPCMIIISYKKISYQVTKIVG